MDTILIVCGAGASSTFLASRVRALAKARGLDLAATAASTLDLDSGLADAGVLLVGPHLQAEFAGLKARAAELQVPAALLPETVFGPTGALEALDLALTLLSSPQNEGTSHG
jgi:PTS system cellobiose-specific IIB component